MTVDAPVPIVFRWLCQMRVAPYSYDWIDNLGRRSPRRLTPGLEALEVGQRFMIFTLMSFEPDHQITLLTDHPVFGEVALTCRVEPDPRGTRLAVKPGSGIRPHPLGWFMRRVLPAGDPVMMHKQLHTIAAREGNGERCGRHGRAQRGEKPVRVTVEPANRIGRRQPVAAEAPGSRATRPSSVSTWKPRARSCGCSVAPSGDRTGVTGAPAASSCATAAPEPSLATFPAIVALISSVREPLGKGQAASLVELERDRASQSRGPPAPRARSTDRPRSGTRRSRAIRRSGCRPRR
jgi:hypothetical protein